MESSFLYEIDGPIATITFNRPERRNCLNLEVLAELEAIVRKVRDNRDLRAMILTGAGPTFCAGADMSALKGVTDAAERRRIFASTGGNLPRVIGRIFDAIAHLEIVTIGAINGPAVGGGWSFVLALDFVIAVESAEFWVPEVDLDTPYRGLPAIAIAARMGPWRARDAILGCRHYSARELFAMGMVNEIVAPERLLPAARELAATMCAKSRKAIAQSKRDINAFFFGERKY